MSKVEKWVKNNEDRNKEGLPTISYEDWLNEHSHSQVTEVIKYLDLDRAGPNWGTRNKQELMKRLLYYISSWGIGSPDEWVSKLSTRLGLSPRTVKENYFIPLIKEGILDEIGSQIHFIGIPKKPIEKKG